MCDEGPVAYRWVFEVVDRFEKNLKEVNLPFDGKAIFPVAFEDSSSSDPCFGQPLKQSPSWAHFK